MNREKMVITEEIKEQIEAIRITGVTNMFDVKSVLKIALELNFDKLADFIFRDTGRYAQYILTGKTEQH